MNAPLQDSVVLPSGLDVRHRRMRQVADRFERLTALFGIAAAALGVLGPEPGLRTAALPAGLIAMVCALATLNGVAELRLWGGLHVKTHPVVVRVVFRVVFWLGVISALVGVGLGLVSAVSAAGTLLG